MAVEMALIIAAAANAILSVGGYVSEQSALKNQRIIDDATIELNREQAKLRAAERGEAHAINFRRALSQQVATAQHRGGMGSVVRQFTSESYGSFLEDQQALKRGAKLVDTQAGLQKVERGFERQAQGIRSFTRLGQGLIDSYSAYNIATNTSGAKPKYPTYKR